MLELKFKRLTETMTVPTKAHDTDACFDLYADIPNSTYEYWSDSDVEDGVRIKYSGGGVVVHPHKTVKIPTGFATNIPHGYWGAVFARSGLATKQGARPANCVGVIDEPYTGEWIVSLHNDSENPVIVQHGDRIAQFTLLPYFTTNLIEVDELDSTDRGDGGFGSSGK